MAIDWAQIYQEIYPVYNAITSSLQLVLLAISCIIAGMIFFLYRMIKKRGQLKNRLGFIHIIPLAVFSTLLIMGIKQSVSDPVAHTGMIIKKWQEVQRPTSYIQMNVTTTHSFSEKGMGKEQKNKSGIQQIKVTPELYKKISVGNPATIISAIDDEGFALILHGKVISPMPGYLLIK